MSKITEFKSIEPLKSNRFIIKFNDEVKIPEYLFRSFKIYNEGKDLIFRTKILDPIGEVVNGLKFKPKGSNMEYKNDYKDDGLSIVKFQFIIDNITPIYKNIES